MAAGLGHRFEHEGTQLIRQLRQLGTRQATQVRRTIYLLEQFHTDPEFLSRRMSAHDSLGDFRE